MAAARCELGCCMSLTACAAEGTAAGGGGALHFPKVRRAAVSSCACINAEGWIGGGSCAPQEAARQPTSWCALCVAQVDGLHQVLLLDMLPHDDVMWACEPNWLSEHPPPPRLPLLRVQVEQPLLLALLPHDEQVGPCELIHLLNIPQPLIFL